MATRTRYNDDVDFAAAKAHDDALIQAQTAILQKVAANTGGSGSVARNLAEAYALISGHISSSTSTEVRNG